MVAVNHAVEFLADPERRLVIRAAAVNALSAMGGDHLDVVGHFRGKGGHTDWLCSGARFNRSRFAQLVDRVVEGMFEGAAG